MLARGTKNAGRCLFAMCRKTGGPYMTIDEILSYREAAILWRKEASIGIPRLRVVYRDLAAAYVSITEDLAPHLKADRAPSSAARPMI
jgi:hypothetical protein